MSTPDIVLFVICGLLTCLGVWAVLELIAQNGRLMLRIEALEEGSVQSPQQPEATAEHGIGQPPGAMLNDFALPMLSGGTMTLLEWRGKKVVLIYVSPQCGHSIKLLPELAEAWKNRAPDDPMPLIITRGEVAENRRLFEEHGIQSPVLLQEDTEVSFLHKALVTPLAYLVDEGGFTVGPARVGRPMILELLQHGEAPPEEESQAGYTSAGVSLGLPGSRLKRDGLPAGTPAPDFTLPALDGSTVSLSDYRGRPVLLVFSDPECRPCQQMAPSLEQIHQSSGNLAVLMISRGDVEENRAKVQEHGLTFPVVLQRKWEISREYGMFSTPIAYMIDEFGILASGVAVGALAILVLAERQKSVRV